MWKPAFFFLFLSCGIDALLKEAAFKAEYGENSYTVAIYEKIDQVFEQKCSGAIIGAKFILTAAHCFFNPDLHLRTNSFRVLTGSNDVMDNQEYQDEIDVEELRIPNLFFVDSRKVALLSDIAVVKLKRSIGYYHLRNRFVQKISLPVNGNGTLLNATVSGFGSRSSVTSQEFGYDNATKVKEERNGVLYHANATILSMKECQEYFPIENKLLTLLHICARVIPRIPGTTGGTCQKDAGAPLSIENHIVGVLSDGPRNCNETVTPGIYTKVLPHIGFIRAAMHDIIEDKSIIVIKLSTVV